MRKFPAALLPLPLGEVASRSDDGEGARRCPCCKSIKCNDTVSGIAQRRPLGGAGAQRLRGFSPILLHYIGSAKPKQV